MQKSCCMQSRKPQASPLIPLKESQLSTVMFWSQRQYDQAAYKSQTQRCVTAPIDTFFSSDGYSVSATRSDNLPNLWNHQLRELLSWAWTNWQRTSEQRQRRIGSTGKAAERGQGWTMGMNLSSKVSHFPPLRSKPTWQFLWLVPILPASRSSNIRQRGEETPSHPGGLSEVGRQRLDDYRRNREKQRGKFMAFCIFAHFLCIIHQRA